MREADAADANRARLCGVACDQVSNKAKHTSERTWGTYIGCPA